MVAIVLILLLTIVIILHLTGSGWWRRQAVEEPDTGQIARGVADVVSGESSGRSEWGALLRGRQPIFGEVLLEMMGRLGVEPDLAAEELKRMGFAVEGPADRAPAHAHRPHLWVLRREEGPKDVLERALLVGIQIARADDDYAGVGDDAPDIEALSRRIEAEETRLFGEGRRERLLLYGKAVLALQDMAQGEAEGERLDAVRALLRVFDEQVASLQAEMDRAMAKIPEPETLLWGDSRDRRLYYFRMGVTNSLRRSGHLESLGHLYRLQGVGYDVEEAYRLAAQECPPLGLADGMGIERLLSMGPVEVQGLVRQALPGGDL